MNDAYRNGATLELLGGLANAELYRTGGGDTGVAPAAEAGEGRQ